MQLATLSPTRATTSAPLEQVRDIPATQGTDPKFNRARQLRRSGALTLVEFGRELAKLREEYFAGGGDRKSKAFKAAKNQTPHDAAFDFAEDGWQAKVRQELGISDDTALRYINDAKRYGQMLQIAQEEVTEIEGHKVTEAAVKKAKEVLAELESDPTVRPARKWAGIWSSVKTKGSQRAEPDHLGLWVNATKTISRIGPQWEKLFRKGDQARAIAELSDALGQLPPHVLAAVIEGATGGRQ